jgi:hypothetical protein
MHVKQRGTAVDFTAATHLSPHRHHIITQACQRRALFWFAPGEFRGYPHKSIILYIAYNECDASEFGLKLRKVFL